MYFNGTLIRAFWENDSEGELHREYYYIIVEFAGAGVAMLFYVSLILQCF